MAGKKKSRTDQSIERAKLLIDVLEEYGEISQSKCAKMLRCGPKTIEMLLVTLGADNLIYQDYRLGRRGWEIWYGITLKNIKKCFDTVGKP